MKIKAIPTFYNGAQFRSRLEARWAALFDQIGWEWDYEPFDLEGWSPDFSINFPNGQVLIEVKPIKLRLFDELNIWSLSDDESFEKARRHYKQSWVLLLGERPQSPAGWAGIGTLLDPPKDAQCSWLDMQENTQVEDVNYHWRMAGSKVQWRRKNG